MDATSGPRGTTDDTPSVPFLAGIEPAACDTSTAAPYHSQVGNDTAVFGRLWTWVAPAREADWDALYAEQLPRVYNFFRYRVGDGPVAQDLTSATFEKAW